jgi:hypothetical protein
MNQYLQQALDLWLWIEKLHLSSRLAYAGTYDKHLVNKVKKIMPLLKNSDWASDEANLLNFVERRLFQDKRVRRERTFDLVKSVVHNDILRPNHIEPLNMIDEESIT